MIDCTSVLAPGDAFFIVRKLTQIGLEYYLADGTFGVVGRPLMFWHKHDAEDVATLLEASWETRYFSIKWKSCPVLIANGRILPGVKL